MSTTEKQAVQGILARAAADRSAPYEAAGELTQLITQNPELASQLSFTKNPNMIRSPFLSNVDVAFEGQTYTMVVPRQNLETLSRVGINPMNIPVPAPGQSMEELMEAERARPPAPEQERERPPEARYAKIDAIDPTLGQLLREAEMHYPAGGPEANALMDYLVTHPQLAEDMSLSSLRTLTGGRDLQGVLLHVEDAPSFYITARRDVDMARLREDGYLRGPNQPYVAPAPSAPGNLDMDAMERDLRAATEGTGITVERVRADGAPVPPRSRGERLLQNFEDLVLSEPVLASLDERRPAPSFTPVTLQRDEPDTGLNLRGSDVGARYELRDGQIVREPVEPDTGLSLRGTVPESVYALRDGQIVREPTESPNAGQPGAAPAAAPAPTAAEIAADNQAYTVMDSIRDKATGGDVAAQAAIADLDGKAGFSVADLMVLQTMGGDKLAELQGIAGTLQSAGVATDAPPPRAEGQAAPFVAEFAGAPTPGIPGGGRGNDEAMLRF